MLTIPQLAWIFKKIKTILKVAGAARLRANYICRSEIRLRSHHQTTRNLREKSLKEQPGGSTWWSFEFLKLTGGINEAFEKKLTEVAVESELSLVNQGEAHLSFAVNI